jgi:predicted alpha/beta hydrolase family esterase
VKNHVLFIHGGGDGAYEKDEKMATSLRNELGAGYDVRYPKMPNEDSAEYEAWKERIAKELDALESEVILVGHSLGGSILLKYLSEEEVEKLVAGLFLVATPYWGVEDWDVDEYALREDFASKIPKGTAVFLYHSREDEVVPFSHAALYAEKLRRATVREFDGRGHQFDDVSEIARDIGRM